MHGFICPTNDIALWYLFGFEGHQEVLLDFCNAVLIRCGRPPTMEIQVKNPFNLARSIDEKGSILDLKAQASDRSWFDIEMQKLEGKDFRKRIRAYWSRLYGDQAISGDLYASMSPVISISVLDFILFKNLPDFIRSCHLRMDEGQHLVFSEDLLFGFLQLPLFTTRSSADLLDQWGNFLKF